VIINFTFVIANFGLSFSDWCTVLEILLVDNYSSIMSRNDDFGRHLRSQFELSENGETKIWQDEIQYQIDILGCAGQHDAKVTALLQLIEVFSKPLQPGIRKIVHPFILELFVRLVPLLLARVDFTIQKHAVILTLLVCLDDNGGFNQSLILPESIISALSKETLCFHLKQSCCLCHTESAVQLVDITPLCNTAAAADVAVGYRTKRKFGAAAPKDVSINENLQRTSTIENIKEKVPVGYGRARSVGSASAAGEDLWYSSPSSVSTINTVKTAPTASVASSPAMSIKSSAMKEEEVRTSASQPVVPIHKRRKLSTFAREHGSRSLPTTEEDVAMISLDFADSAPVIAAPIISQSSNRLPAKTAARVQPASDVSSTLNIRNRLKHIFSAFFCETCQCSASGKAKSSENSAAGVGAADAVELRLFSLVLLNRYLASKVQALAMLHTDMFQKQQDTADSSNGAKEEGDAAAFVSIKSPPDGTSNGSSEQRSEAYYKRQFQSLQRCQAAMAGAVEFNEINRDDCFIGSVFETSCLAGIRDALAQDCNTITLFTRSNASSYDDNRKSWDECLVRTSKARVWLALGIIECVCFKCPSVQVRLNICKLVYYYTNASLYYVC
jgi:hypothetical protein